MEADLKIEKVTKSHLLHACREFLSADLLNNVLPYGDLYTPLFGVSEVYAAVEKGKVAGVVSVFHAFSLPSVAVGTATRQVKTALLRKALGTISTDFIALITPDEINLYEEFATVLHSYMEYHMILIQPRNVEANNMVAQKATRKDLEALNMFYAKHESQAWNPVQFKAGPYYIVRKRNKIVSAAGIHIFTPQIAQLGNILTDKVHRRKGYSKACTTALIREISSINRVIGLFVRTDNAPAIRMYEQMGFEKAKTVHFLIMRKKPKSR